MTTFATATRLRSLLFAGAAIALCPGAAAWAADGPTKATEVDTVVVTAEHTRENILNVGANVTALTPKLLQETRTTTATDLATLVPNLDVKTNVPGAQEIITVRGVGLDDFSSTNNSSVGVYVDDVFLASFAEMDFTLYDFMAATRRPARST